MNAEQLKRGVQRKEEVEKVAKELGYDSVNAAAEDLRSLGILDKLEPLGVSGSESPFVDAMIAEEKPPEYDMLTNQEARDIARKAARMTYSKDQLGYVVRRVGNKYITIQQFTFLLNGVKDFAEDDLFGELVDNIFDLHNYKKIGWTYSHDSGEVYRKYKGLYPAMKGKEYEMPSNVGFVVGTLDPVEKASELPAKVIKQFKKKEVGIIAAASAFIGFLIGALLF